MQIAQQVFGIETAENALIFFGNRAPAYITKRFDVVPCGLKLAQEDFVSLAVKSPQTHGTDYKYLGSYWERNNQNEIDIVAVNDMKKTVLFAEVKRNPGNISIRKLEEKSENLKQQFKGYTFEFFGYSLENM